MSPGDWLRAALHRWASVIPCGGASSIRHIRSWSPETPNGNGATDATGGDCPDDDAIFHISPAGSLEVPEQQQRAAGTAPEPAHGDDVRRGDQPRCTIFGYTAPTGWGVAGPNATNQYEYSIRTTTVGGPAFSDRQGDPTGWTNPRLHATTSIRVNWASQQATERLQLRVRARDASNPVQTSDWLVSEVITEGEPLPGGGGDDGPFSDKFGPKFDGGE